MQDRLWVGRIVGYEKPGTAVCFLLLLHLLGTGGCGVAGLGEDGDSARAGASGEIGRVLVEDIEERNDGRV